MTEITAARAWLVEQLDIAGVTVYPVPPEVATPPAVILAAGEPWLTGVTFTGTRIRFDVVVVVGIAGGNLSAIERLETTVWAVLEQLRPLVVVESVSAPLIRQYGSSELLTATIPITLEVED
jgi:hypothetical protein